MIAAWYEEQGPSRVLILGEMPTSEPAAGEVRVRVSLSSVNPGDTKKRRGWQGSGMPYPRVVPHSDGAGVVDEVGPGVDPSRVGERVWVFGAQSYRALGTAAQYVVVPEWQAVGAPNGVEDALVACLGIPGITAHRAVFGDGSVEGKTVLVQGVLGAVGSLAAQLARWNGATVIGTVRTVGDVDAARERGHDSVVALGDVDVADQIRAFASGPVDRIVEVALSENVELDTAVAGNGTVVAAYGTRSDRPVLPFWPMLFSNMTLRLLGSDDFPREAKESAAADLTAAAGSGALSFPVAPPMPLADIATAHDRVDHGSRERVTLAIP
ncbi:NADPH:quinone reductase [Rhodococcus sp. BP-316]|uniref:NADPH:quinone reductase n=1 Tax=Rhodococcus sp. BP-316 TaxID=2739445 RepID=UPI001C9B6C8C|nr:NADPH:quinone reductase [Rhodococcus sp. BP-316]MBY6681515.1 NADPH:quinone reductase [Rhodococcus sp. BP-316]